MLTPGLTEALRSLSRRAPLLAFAAGLWAGCAFPPPGPSWLLLPALLALGRRSPLAALGHITLGILLGGWLTAQEAQPTCPPPGAHGEWLARVLELSPERSGRQSVRIEITRERHAAGGFQCQAVVSTGRRAPEALEGDVIWTPPLALEEPVRLVNPLIGDSAEALLQRGVQRVGALPDGAALLTLRREPSWLRWRAVLRAKATLLLRDLPDTPAREVVRALGLGQRGGMSAELLDAFRDSGIRHLLTLGVFYLSIWMAIVAALAALLWGRAEAAALRFPARRAAALCTLPLPILYGVLGDGPSARRAAILGLALAGAVAFGRARASALHFLSLGLLGLLAWAPDQARNPALLWSVAAVAGISFLAAPWLARPPSSGLRGRLGDQILATLAVGAGAFLATAPLQIATAHRIALLTVPLGLIGLAVALPCALLSQLGVLLTSGPLLRAALPAASALAELATVTARFGQTVSLPTGTLLAYAAVLGLALLALQRKRWKLGISAIGLALLIWCAPRLDSGSARLRLTFLSVGHGDATVIQTPHGHVIVIDSGGSVVGEFDPGRQIVVPFLEASGVRRVDLAILSHPHPDHANGLPAVFRSFPVTEYWHSPEPCPLEACGVLSALIKEKGTREVALGTAPFSFELDGVRLTLLSPQLPGGYDPDLGPNDNSLVFSLQFGDFRALLTGDIEATAEARLVKSGADLSTFLLKAPHHGSDTSSTAEFVRRVHPAIVVFSVGPRNRFDFPRRSVVDRYAAAGVRAFRTDLDGALTVETDGHEVWATPTLPHSAVLHLFVDAGE